MKKILIIGVVLIIIIIIILILINFMIYYINYNVKDKGGMENKRIQHFTLQKVTYIISGDSIGSYSSMEMQHFENYDLLTVTVRASVNAENVKKEYILSKDSLLNFTNVISKYNYENWENLPQSDNYALDAGTHDIIIQFSNNELYSINKYKVLPKSEENLFETVIGFLNENIKK